MRVAGVICVGYVAGRPADGVVFCIRRVGSEFGKCLSGEIRGYPASPQARLGCGTPWTRSTSGRSGAQPWSTLHR